MIYAIRDSENRRVKFGYAARSGLERLSLLQTGSSNLLFLEGEAEGDRQDEHAIHKKLRLFCARPGSEWYLPSDEVEAIVAVIKAGKHTSSRAKIMRDKMPSDHAAKLSAARNMLGAKHGCGTETVNRTLSHAIDSLLLSLEQQLGRSRSEFTLEAA